MSPVKAISPEQQGFFPAPPPELMPDQLDTQAKLKVLWEDELAGFLPATNHEKNQAVELLDYVGNPKYPAGIGNRLQEIFLRQKNAEGPEMAKRALISIALEYGDYLINATDQAMALETLRAGIHNCPNPFVSLEEELGKGHLGFAPLVRFIDLSEMRDKGYVSGAKFSPMYSRSNRNNSDDTRNKTVDDPYTVPQPRKDVAKRIEAKAQELTIGDSRQLVVEALTDQQKRAAFWEARLRETRAHGAAWIIGRKILEELELPLR